MEVCAIKDWFQVRHNWGTAINRPDAGLIESKESKGEMALKSGELTLKKLFPD